ncbi:MAG: hypothetical protein IPP91_16865 [Betaproteobacteria bacterium]|nr:hypothetical protein [Betaproteobacteria bacterium]
MKILMAIDGFRYALAAARFVAQHVTQQDVGVDLVHSLPPPDRTIGVAESRQRSVALEVARSTPCPVRVVRDSRMGR